MKYFLSVICFAIVHFAVAQQPAFDYDLAWEDVYIAELRWILYMKRPAANKNRFSKPKP